MITVEDYEAIRRAYYLEKKSIRQIAREQHHSRKTIRRAIRSPASTLSAYNKTGTCIWCLSTTRVDALLAQNKTLPKKQPTPHTKSMKPLLQKATRAASHVYESILANGRKNTKPLKSFFP